MNQQNPKAINLIRVILTLTGLGLLAGSLLYWFLASDSGDNMKLIVSGALALAGFMDLIISWVVFRGKEN